MARTVAILGGGVAGLSAAHELAERGFEVTVYEARELPAARRARPVPGSGTDGRADLPAEHGFRFFPGFYRHLPDTMRRIPVAGSADGVAGNLVGATRVLSRRRGGATSSRRPRTRRGRSDDLQALDRFLRGWALEVGIPRARAGAFVERLLTLLTSCDERRCEQWEQQSWWEFTRRRAAQRGIREVPRRRADAQPRRGPRARDERAHRRATSCCSCSFDLTRAGGHADRVLNAPTNDAWITPWVAHLAAPGSTLRLGAPVVGDRVRRAADHGRDDRRRGRRGRARRGRPLRRRAAGRAAAAAAHPRDAARRAAARRARPAGHALDERDHVLSRRGRRARARPRDLHRLRVGADVDLAGAVLGRRRLASATATAACRGSCRSTSRSGSARRQRTGKVASKCTAEEIRAEVWAQLKDHLNDGDAARRERRRLVPRPGDRVPEPDERDEPRAAARQHRRLVGTTGRTRRRGSRTSTSRRTSFARTPTSRRWRAQTRPPAARSTRSSNAAARARRAARCGARGARRSSPRRARSTSSAGRPSPPAKPLLRVAADGGWSPPGRSRRR